MATSDSVLLISAPASGQGGLFVAERGRVSMIDPISTSGLALANGCVYRLFSCDRYAESASDFTVYDADGAVRTQRLDGVGHAHDILVRDNEVFVASPATNAIYEVQPNGATRTWWQANEAYDAWHVNCMLFHAGELYITVFGKFQSSFGWNSVVEYPNGMVIHLPSGEPLLRGLTQPHHPRRFDDMWVVCNSRKGELLAFNDRGTLVRKREFAGYTRGLAVDRDYIYVGENHRRRQGFADNTARIAVLDRNDWKTIDRFQLPVPEVYDLLLVPPDLAKGIEKDNWTQMLSGPQKSNNSGWIVGEPLNAFDMRVGLEMNPPEVVLCNSAFSLPCRLTNLGKAVFVSAPPYPVEFSYKWWTSGKEPLDDRPIRNDLPGPVFPGEQIDASLLIAAPAEPGHYRFAITVIQAGIGSFEHVDPRNAVYTAITVRESPGNAVTRSAAYDD
jgi:acetolactate synthase-1/2/3 large subunit